jgi:hypothetical protein
MYFADVSKCFNSIYTHTLFWAICGVKTAKESTSASTFSNAFDRLMQSMNYNETNGICIGAETSRIFAELIFSEVDRMVINAMTLDGLSYRGQYEFKRYVDDYYLFAENDKTARKLLAAISTSLSKFNLHLNDGKTIPLKRPFITPKARLIRDTNDSLEAFFGKFLSIEHHIDGSFLIPRSIWRPDSLLRSLLDSIKASCYDHDAGYEGVSNYVIGALAIRVTSVVSDYSRGIAIEGITEDHYLAALVLMLEAMYFFYNVHPSIPSSLRVAQAAIQSARLVAQHMPDRRAFLGEQLVRWTFQFIRGWSHSASERDLECVPLEALNILLVLGEVGRNDAIAQKAILDYCGSVRALNYFEIVTFLFCIGNSALFDTLRHDLLARARELILNGEGVRIDAQAAHLSLDLLTCPHLTLDVRGGLFNELRHHVGLPILTVAEATEAVRAFEAEAWFVNWREADLLRMIRKKELSQVY